MDEERRQPGVKKTEETICLTLVIDIDTAVFQLDAENILAQGFVVMRNAFLRSSTKRQREIIVGLLPVVVGTDGVHPEHHFLRIVVLKKKTFDKVLLPRGVFLSLLCDRVRRNERGR